MKDLLRHFLARFDLAIESQPAPLVYNRNKLITPTLRMVVRDLLDLQKATFLLVGAFDGITNDELYPLVTEYHWRGVALEPQPSAFHKLTEVYRLEPQVKLLNAALDWSIGQRKMFQVKPEHQTEHFHPQLASFSREVVLNYPGVTDSKIESFAVDCVDVAECIKRGGIVDVDLLQIDTEGFDYEIIKMVNAAGMLPRIIRYERAHLSRADDHDCLNHLLDKGYKISASVQDVVAALIP